MRAITKHWGAGIFVATCTFKKLACSIAEGASARVWGLLAHRHLCGCYAEFCSPNCHSTSKSVVTRCSFVSTPTKWFIVSTPEVDGDPCLDHACEEQSGFTNFPLYPRFSRIGAALDYCHILMETMRVGDCSVWWSPLPRCWGRAKRNDRL
jgi:hypothetical protein